METETVEENWASGEIWTNNQLAGTKTILSWLKKKNSEKEQNIINFF